MNSIIKFFVCSAFALIIVGCGRGFTPSTQSDIDDITEKLSKRTEQSNVCVNENIVLEFGSVETSIVAPNGMQTYGRKPNVKVSTLSEARKSSLDERVTLYNYGSKYDFEAKRSVKGTVHSLLPTIIGRYSASAENAKFVKAVCDNATSAQLNQFFFEKGTKDGRSTGFNSLDHDTVYEVWNCKGPCN